MRFTCHALGPRGRLRQAWYSRNRNACAPSAASQRAGPNAAISPTPTISALLRVVVAEPAELAQAE
jgi:hypothetical protein